MEQLKQKLKTLVSEHKTGIAVVLTIVGSAIVGKQIYYAGARYGCLATVINLSDEMPEANILGAYRKSRGITK